MSPDPAQTRRQRGASLRVRTGRSLSLHAGDVALHQAKTQDLVRALAWAPTYWYTWNALGCRLADRGSREAVALGEHYVAVAAGYDPNNYRLWADLGKFRLSLRDNAGARQAFARARQLRPWLSLPPVPEDAR